MGYSLCMIADFQNCLISRILSGIGKGFLHRTILNDFRTDFDMFFWNFNF